MSAEVVSLGVGLLVGLKLYLDRMNREENVESFDNKLFDGAVLEEKQAIEVVEVEENEKVWDEVVDVCVVGSGAAGCSASLAARYAGPPGMRVLVLEKDDQVVGGTTAKSGGVFWIPNNPIMQRNNLKDDRDDAIKFICRVSYPEAFDLEKEFFGLEEHQYDKIVNYYDTGSKMLQEMMDRGVMPNLATCTKLDGEPLADYAYSELDQPDNKAPYGRALGTGTPWFIKLLIQSVAKITAVTAFITDPLGKTFPALKDINLLNNFGIDLSYGIGAMMVERLTESMRNEAIEIRMGSSVETVFVSKQRREVLGVGVKNMSSSDRMRTIGATKGVIFATGGFSMNKYLMDKYLPGPVYQTGACQHAQGDAVIVAQKLGAELELMDKIWGCETLLEEALESPWESHTGLLQMRGDAFFVVNSLGKRVYNEKSGYDKRVRVHWSDPEHNQFLFMIGDEQCVSMSASNFAKQWPADLSSPLYIKGNTIPELVRNLDARIKSLSARYDNVISPDYLDEKFTDNLLHTMRRFNQFALKGTDRDFLRGSLISDRQWTVAPTNTYPNICMRPLNPEGPYYAVIVAASVLDTKGGPKVNVHGQPFLKNTVIPQIDDDSDEESLPTVIQGIYFVGNCGSPISGDNYWSGGATLGSCLVSGWTAGTHCALNNTKKLLTTAVKDDAFSKI